jgi:beta-glucosidase
VDLAPGQSRLVVFRLSASDLAYYDQGSNRFTVAPGRYTVLVGTSSTELDHADSFQVGRPGG